MKTNSPISLKTVCALIAALAFIAPSVFAKDDAGTRVELKAGFAQVDITPPIGGIITGPMGPTSTGTDDPLKAQ